MSAIEEDRYSPLGGHAMPNGHAPAKEEEEEEEDADAEEVEEEEEEEEEGQGRRDSSSSPAPVGPASSSKAGSANRTPQPKKAASLNSLAFPLARVKRVIKSESDEDMRMSVEATYAIAKGVGLFLDKFVEQSFEHMIEDKRHSLTYKDLATHVSRARRFQFLADFVPEKVTAASALSRRVKEEGSS